MRLKWLEMKFTNSQKKSSWSALNSYMKGWQVDSVTISIQFLRLSVRGLESCKFILSLRFMHYGAENRFHLNLCPSATHSNFVSKSQVNVRTGSVVIWRRRNINLLSAILRQNGGRSKYLDFVLYSPGNIRTYIYEPFFNWWPYEAVRRFWF